MGWSYTGDLTAQESFFGISCLTLFDDCFLGHGGGRISTQK
jgi:hypothetical protein